jgi:hypothetical protein
LAGLLDQVYSQVAIGDARQLNQDAVLALELDDRLGDAQAVDAVLDDAPRRLHLLRRGRRAARQVGGEQDLQSALQVEALLELQVAPAHLLPEDQVAHGSRAWATAARYKPR